MAAKSQSQSQDTKLIMFRLDDLGGKIDKLDAKIDDNYATKEELKSVYDKLDAKFSPGLKLIYGLVGIVLIGVAGALMSLVVRKP